MTPAAQISNTLMAATLSVGRIANMLAVMPTPTDDNRDVIVAQVENLALSARFADTVARNAVARRLTEVSLALRDRASTHLAKVEKEVLRLTT